MPEEKIDYNLKESDESLDGKRKSLEPTQKEEKLEFLKREEIRTMQKDIAVLREKEAQKERERITKIVPEAKKKIEEKKGVAKEGVSKKEVAPEKEVPKPGFLMPELPKKPSPSKKILIRGSIFLLFLLVLGSFYWFFWVKRPPTKDFVPPTQEEVTPQTEEEEKPEIPLPSPLIPVEKTKILEVATNEEIPVAFNLIMREEIEEGIFLQVLIKNTTENRLVSLEDLSTAFQIGAPEQIYQELGEDFTLFVYSQKEGNRVGIIAQMREREELAKSLSDWEVKIGEEGISISGQEISSLGPNFRTTYYKETAFRYLTISKEDLGICYALFDDYLVITSSFESMEKSVDKIGAGKLEEKFGQLFIVGFEGKTLTPQLERFFKKYKPGGVLLLSKNIESREQLKGLITDLQNLSERESGFPLFIAVDQEGEPISRIQFLEEKIAQSDIVNATTAFQVGQNRGKELKELGVNLNLAPVLDAMESGDFYFNRTFQKSVSEIGELSKALILGQREAGILTAIKHFPGYVGISFNPEAELAVVEKVPEISQFRKVMEATPEFVIAANVIYKEIDPSLPFTFSTQGIELIKNNLSSEILIISDDLSQTSLLENFSLKEIVTKPIQAGVDILIFSGFTLPVEQGLDAFLEAVENEEIDVERFEEAVSKIIQLKEELLK